MKRTPKAALLTVALATAASATVLTAPASAGHGGGVSSYASVQLRTVARAIRTVSLCTEMDGVKTCKDIPVALTAENIKMRVDYTLARFETHVPLVDTAAGQLPEAECSTTTPTPSEVGVLTDRIGARLALSGVTLTEASVVALEFQTTDEEVKHYPVKPHATSTGGPFKTFSVSLCI